MIQLTKLAATAALLFCLAHLGQAEQYRLTEIPSSANDRLVPTVLKDDGLLYGNHFDGTSWLPAKWSPAQGLTTWQPVPGYRGFAVAGADSSGPNVYGAAIDDGGFGYDKPVRWSPTTGYVFQDYATGNTGRGVSIRGANDTGTMVGIEVHRLSGGIYGNAIYLPDGTSLTEPQGGYLKDVNNAGYILGDSFHSGGQRLNLRDPNGNWTALPFSGGFGVAPCDINDSGQALGAGMFRRGTNLVKYQPVLNHFPTNSFQVIPTLREYDVMKDSAQINDAGIVVSSFEFGVPGESPTEVVELWTEAEGTRNLDTLLDTQATTLGYHMTTVYGLNNRNEMYGYANQGGRTYVRVLLQPVPEPGTLIALGAGPLALLLRLRTRK